MSGVCFVDIETTSLHADTGDVWEVGLIDPSDHEWRWLLPVTLEHADPISLQIGGFHRRHPHGNAYEPAPGDHGVTELGEFASSFAALTHGCHLAGAVISFDEERLRRLLWRAGHIPSWHYHLIDVEALAVGWLAGRHGPADTPIQLPWDSKALSAAVGVDTAAFAAHEALEDARWARAIYRAVMGS